MQKPLQVRLFFGPAELYHDVKVRLSTRFAYGMIDVQEDARLSRRPTLILQITIKCK